MSKSTMSDSQRAEVTYAFFNANKEKILGNLDNAAGLFSEVIRKDPNNAAAMYELANIYNEQKKFADALFFAKGAYQLDTKNSWYILTYTDLLQKNKNLLKLRLFLKKQLTTILRKPITIMNWLLHFCMQKNLPMQLRFMINWMQELELRVKW
ncbi:MAG: tetratricopeptide repeat protein [Bacteroidetes bacterium]|nr:tetratricopeptide repeat protein [Bacteroidota bacterium]